jgi:tetratricopeptide (TPR) repeat protein
MIALADYYVRTKRPKDALTTLDKLAAGPATWPIARARAATVLYSQGEHAEAYKAIDEVIAKHPTYAQGHLVRGRFLLDEGKLDNALSEAPTAVKLEPGSADAQFLLGLVHERRRELEPAAAAFNEVLRLNPRAQAAQLRLAQVQLQRGSPADTTKLAGQVAERQPGNLEARLMLARGYLASGDVDRAVTVTRELLSSYPESGRVHAQAGMLALRRGDAEAARASFDKALALDPGLLEPLAGLVASDLRQGHQDVARKRVEARLETAPTDSRVLLLAGRTWQATGDSAGAEDFLRRAIQADPSNFEGYSALVQLYAAGGKLDLALAEADRLAARQPGAVGPRTVGGLILLAQGRTDEARRRFEQVVEDDPRAAVASNNLAYLYASKGEQLDRALQLAQAAKAGLPENASVNDTLGFVYLKKQLPSLAIPFLRLAIKTSPSNPEFHYHLGTALAQTGDKAGARDALEQALRLKTPFEGADEARRLLGTLGS